MIICDYDVQNGVVGPWYDYDVQNGVVGPWQRAERSARPPHSTCGSGCKALCGAHIRWQDMGSGDHNINIYKPYGSSHIDKHIKRNQSAIEEITGTYLIDYSCPSSVSAMSGNPGSLEDPGTLMKNLSEDGRYLVLILP